MLSLYFKLQDQKTSVVSSTASASLRQAVVLVFERVGTSKGKEIAQPYKIALPEGETVHLSADELDAYELFSDLCVLTEGKKGAQDRVKILKMSNIVPTFGLELLESVLSGFADGFRTVSYAHACYNDRRLMVSSRSNQNLSRRCVILCAPSLSKSSPTGPVFP